MTPEEHRTSGPDEAEVRRLLAALGSDPVPMPPEVAARLDATLTGLSAEREQSDAGSPAEGDRATEAAPAVTPLPARERPRRWPQLLVAAAAVSVLGLGVAEVLEGSSGADSMNAATAERAEDAPADASGGEQQDGAEAAPEPYAAQDSAPPSGPTPERREQLDRRYALSRPPAALSRLHSDSLAPGVQRIVDFTVTDTSAQDAPLTALRDGAGCALPDPGAGGDLYAVRLDGDPATLLLHPAEDGRRLAEVFACDDASAPVASTLVDAG